MPAAISKVVEVGCVPFVVLARERPEFEGAQEVVGFWAEWPEHGGECVEWVAVLELELKCAKEVTDGDVEGGFADRFGDPVNVPACDDPEEFVR